MTRFETTSGTQLGVTFFGDKGRTFHLTNEELKTLWNLNVNVEVVSDNLWRGTVKELLNLLSQCDKCSEEQLRRRFKKELTESLHFRTNRSSDGSLFLTK